MNSRLKAMNIGLEGGKAAEEEGWGEGQPLVRVMGRDVRVMKRWGYEWGDDVADTVGEGEEKGKEPALWGVDLEALRKANQPGEKRFGKGGAGELPIFTAQSARAYLMKAFETPAGEMGKEEHLAKAPAKSKRTAATIAAQRGSNLGLLLGALELLYRSWSAVLSKEDLDKRAWGWYVRVRPEVANGAAGWGGKGNVKLSDILELRRPTVGVGT
jgi:hypothetical protein